MKEIRPDRAGDPASRVRFVREAEVTGRLEHPGIVPVYGLGHYDDGRPFYAMRFIPGDNLKETIAAFHAGDSLGPDPSRRDLGLRKLLRRFLDVCDAVAYAHGHGVLHRDLKPDNVMVGRFGETLVVDWGLAKIAGRSPDDGLGALPETTLPYDPPGGEGQTRPGSRLGTPAYMSPEQAAGRHDLLGPASDVYSLGATLYHLLAGRPPVADADVPEVLRKVERGEFARPREASPWLDPASEAVCLKAMANRPEDRYPSHRALADDVERWLADSPVSAWREPWSRRAGRWSRRHRTAVATVAATALVVALAFGTSGWQRSVQAQRTDSAALAMLDQAERLAEDARASGEIARWERDAAEARRALDRIEAGGGTPELRSRIASRLDAFAAERDRRGVESRAVDDLEGARLRASGAKDGHFDSDAKHAAYLKAFQACGVDVAALPVDEAARRIRASRIADDLIAALDDWSGEGPSNVPASKLGAIAREADADTARATIRDAIARRDAEALRQLCRSEESRRELGPRVRSVFAAMRRLDPIGNLPLLEPIRSDLPGDFWLNNDLGWVYLNADPPRPRDAVRWLSAAVSLRPDSPNAHDNLGAAPELQGDLDGAIAEYRRAIRLRPDYAQGHNNLGLVLRMRGDLIGAASALRRAIRLKPDRPAFHTNLGLILRDQGDTVAEIAAHREAIRLESDYAEAHSNLGTALARTGDLDGALDEHRLAVRLKPDYAEARSNFGVSLQRAGEIDRAIEEHRKATQLEPDNARYHYNLGNALLSKNDNAGAVDEYRRAIRLKPDHAEAHSNLGLALRNQGDIAGAIAEHREAIRINPDISEAHYNLGSVLASRGDIDGAIGEFREAIRIRPDDAMSLCNLGSILQLRGRYREALGHLERGHEIGSRRPNWRYPSDRWLAQCRRLVELDAKLPAVSKGEARPKDADERATLAGLCVGRSLHAAAARFWAEAFAERPDLAADHSTNNRYNAACSASLAGTGHAQDDPPPDDSARARLRELALGWLRDDLAARAKILEGGNPEVPPFVVQTLDRWKVDPDLAGIRDEPELAKLPEAEREAFRSLWAGVEALRKKAGGG